MRDCVILDRHFPSDIILVPDMSSLVLALDKKLFDAGGENADIEYPEYLVAKVVCVPTGIQVVDPALDKTDIGHDFSPNSVAPREQNPGILQQGGRFS